MGREEISIMSYFLEHLINGHIGHLNSFLLSYDIFLKFSKVLHSSPPCTPQCPLPLRCAGCPPVSLSFSIFPKRRFSFHAAVASPVLCRLPEMPVLHSASESLLFFLFSDSVPISPPLGSLPRLIHPYPMSELVLFPVSPRSPASTSAVTPPHVVWLMKSHDHFPSWR